ncbi:MAG: DUF503 domain-containing protein [Myxococcota bacterium]
MIVAASVLETRIHGSQSLKAKRGVVRSITQRVRNRFNLSVAEVGGQQTWQRAELGLCAVGGDRVHTRGLIERAIEFIEELHLAEVVASDIEIVNLPYEPQAYGDLSGEEPDPEG